MNLWRTRPGGKRVIVEDFGSAVLVRAAGDAAQGLMAMTSALQIEPGRIAIVTASSVTKRPDYLRIVGQVIDHRMRREKGGVRLVPLGAAAALSAVEPQLHALSQHTGREIVAPLGSLTVAMDGTLAVAAPSRAGGGWATYAPGRAPYYEAAWFPQPAWAKDLPPATTGVSASGAAATYPVPAGYSILPRGVSPGRAGTASSVPPDPAVPMVFLGGFGDLPLALEDVILSLAALPFPGQYRLVLLPGALRTSEDAVYLREHCNSFARVTAAVPVWSEDRGACGLAFVGPAGGLTRHVLEGDRPGPRPSRRDASDYLPALPDTVRPGRRDDVRVRTGVPTAAGWSFALGTEPVGVVPTPAGFVAEVTMDADGFQVDGKLVTPSTLADLIAGVCPAHCRTVVVIAHSMSPPTAQVADSLFGVLANALDKMIIAADSEISMSRTGLLHTSGQFSYWRALPRVPGHGRQVWLSAALGKVIPPPPLPAMVSPGPERSALTPRSALVEPVEAPPPARLTAVKRTVAKPAGPLWITKSSCDAEDRLRLRQLLDTKYETHARIVVHHLLRDQGTRHARTAAAVGGLVALRAYCVEERASINGRLRGTDQARAGNESTLIAECAMHGLRQLPAVSGPVFATCLAQVPLTAYRPGAELIEPAFIDVELSPNDRPGEGVDYYIWSHCARDLGVMEPDGRSRAIFPPGSRFQVLGVEGGSRRPRVTLLDLCPADGSRVDAPDPEPTIAEIVEALRHRQAPAGTKSASAPEPLAFPLGLDDSRRPYQRRDGGDVSAVETRPRTPWTQDGARVPTLAREVLLPNRPADVDRTALGPVQTGQAEAEADQVAVVAAIGLRAEVRVAAPVRLQWLEPGAPEPAAILPAVLGEDGHRQIFLDLATMPGMLTVTGPLPLCRRYALGIAERISARFSRVMVVGDALDTMVAPGWQRCTDLPEIDAAEAGSGIVIATGLRGTGLQWARHLAPRTGGRYVAVVIGEVLRSRWSISVERATL